MRSELPTTTNELKLIESAATRGVTNPITASGTATTLYNNEKLKFSLIAV